MREEKFKSILDKKIEMTEKEWRTSYPELTDEQIVILLKGDKADEPSRKSILSFTKAD